jgi:hypothetical protein
LHRVYFFPAGDCFVPGCHSDSLGLAYLVVACLAEFDPANLD